jgi:hypothetical protein
MLADELLRDDIGLSMRHLLSFANSPVSLYRHPSHRSIDLSPRSPIRDEKRQRKPALTTPVLLLTASN